MENRSKSQIFKMFQSPFNICRPKNTSDVSDHRVFSLENRHHRPLIDLFSPKPQPLSSSSSKPKPQLPRPKFSDQHVRYPADTDCRKPHSVSPPFHEKTSKRCRKKKPHHRKNRKSESFSSITDNYYNNCCSSYGEDESDNETTLFSWRSISSDSSELCRTAQKPSGKRRVAGTRADGGGCLDLKVTDVGVPVVKKSSNPYEDFRASMAEMIVEKQIFESEELEKLLECFLSLNSEENHKIIVEVFAEIRETMFSDLFQD